MEWLKKLLEKHTKDGKLDLEAFMAEAATEFPKAAVPKDKYNELSEAKKKLEGDLQARDAQLEELKKAAGASENLKKQIETLQADNKKKDEDYQTQLKDLTLTNAIKLAVTGIVHDEGLVAGLFDKSKLVIDGDKVVGLEEQVKSLKETKAFLFKEEKEQPKPGFKIGTDGKEVSAEPGKSASLFDAVGAALKQQT